MSNISNGSRTDKKNSVNQCNLWEVYIAHGSHG